MMHCHLNVIIQLSPMSANAFIDAGVAICPGINKTLCHTIRTQSAYGDVINEMDSVLPNGNIETILI